MAKRLLILATDLEVGGVPLLIKNIALGLDGRDFEVHVACLSPPGPVSEELAAAGIPTHALNARGPQDFVVAIRLARLLSCLRPDVLFTALVHANFMGRLVGRLLGIRRIFSSIHTVEKEKRWHLQLENLFCRLSNKTVCVSHAVFRQVKEVCHAPLSQMALIRNGVEIEDFNKIEEPSIKIPGLSPDRTVLIFVGRLDAVKGVDILIRAVSILNEKMDALHLLIVGDGAIRSELEALTTKLNLSDKVSFLGTRRDIPALLRLSDIKVMPSYWEGLPVSAIEAMAAGVPVIASDVEGLNEVVRDNVTGILIPPGNPEMLAKAIFRCVANPQLSEEMGKNGRKIATRDFSRQRMITSYKQLFST
jgi:glycosyltransferase involved in cell wall biosynthesis